VILADTSVLLDVLKKDPQWALWSLSALEAAAAGSGLAINDVIYAELSTRFASVDDVDAVVNDMGLALIPIPRAALFLAGKAYQRYRTQGGTRTGVLSDFFIGAHAAVEGWTLLTRDAARVRSYFPGVTLIAP